MSVESDAYENPGAGVGFKAKASAPKLTTPNLYMNRELTQEHRLLLEAVHFVTISEAKLGEFL